MDEHVPNQPELVTLRTRLGADTFEAGAQAAEQKLGRVRAVESAKQAGNKTRLALREAVPPLSSSTFRRYRAHLRSRPGQEWERLVDRRVPPKSWEVPESWRGLAIGCAVPDRERRSVPGCCVVSRVHSVV